MAVGGLHAAEHASHRQVLLTVAVGLNSLDDSEFSIFAAGSMFVAVPIIVLYVALSKYLIQGGSAGAVKE